MLFQDVVIFVPVSNFSKISSKRLKVHSLPQNIETSQNALKKIYHFVKRKFLLRKDGRTHNMSIISMRDGNLQRFHQPCTEMIKLRSILKAGFPLSSDSTVICHDDLFS